MTDNDRKKNAATASAPITNDNHSDDPHNSREALIAAGFSGDADAQQRFIVRLSKRFYARAEVVTNRAMLSWTGALLGGIGMGFLVWRGQDPAAAVVGVAALGHLILAANTSWRGPQLTTNDGTGALPALVQGETLVLVAQASAKESIIPRVLSGLFHMSWGILVGGLPVIFAKSGMGFGLFALLALGTFVGAGIFGRGARALFFTHPAERLALTSQRLVLLNGKGERSIPLTTLRQRPTVIARGDGRASFAAEFEPQSSVAPLPFMGLVGLDDVSVETAKTWAGAVMEARKRVLEEKVQDKPQNKAGSDG